VAGDPAPASRLGPVEVEAVRRGELVDIAERGLRQASELPVDHAGEAAPLEQQVPDRVVPVHRRQGDGAAPQVAGQTPEGLEQGLLRLAPADRPAIAFEHRSDPPVEGLVVERHGVPAGLVVEPAQPRCRDGEVVGDGPEIGHVAGCVVPRPHGLPGEERDDQHQPVADPLEGQGPGRVVGDGPGTEGPQLAQDCVLRHEGGLP
jgi:hypothetical protein